MIKKFLPLFTSDLIGRFITFIVSTLVFREYGGKALASLLLVYGILSIGIQFIENALNNVALRSVASRDNKIQVATEIRNFKNFLGVVFISIVLVTYTIQSNEYLPYILYLILFVPITVQNTQFLLQIQSKFALIGLIRIISAISTLVISIVLIRILTVEQSQIIGFAYVVSALVFTLLTNYFSGLGVTSLMSFPKWQSILVFNRYKRAWRDGIAYVAIQVFNLSTLLILQNSESDELVSSVGISVRIWYLLIIPSTILCGIYLVQMINHTFELRVFLRNLLINVLLSFVIVTTCLLFLEKFIHLFFGEEALRYVEISSNFSWSVIPYYVVNLCTVLLIYFQKHLAIVFSYFVSIMFIRQSVNRNSFLLDYQSELPRVWLTANLGLGLILIITITYHLALTKYRSTRQVIVGASGWLIFGYDLIALNIIKKYTQNGRINWVLVGGPFGIEKGPGFPDLRFKYVSIRKRLLVIAAIYGSSNVIIGGGGLIVTNNELYRQFYRISRLSDFLGVPYALLGVGVEIRHNNKSTLRKLSRLFEKSTSISVRDNFSKSEVQKISPDIEVDIIEDPALWFRNFQESTKVFDLAINLRPLKILQNHKEQDIPSLIAPLIESLNASYEKIQKIALISLSENKSESDIKILKNLKAQLVAEVTIIGYENVTQIIESIGKSRSMISMRLHGMLVSNLLGLPTLGIAYDQKVASHGDNLGIPYLFLDSEDLGDKFAYWLSRN